MYVVVNYQPAYFMEESIDMNKDRHSHLTALLMMFVLGKEPEQWGIPRG